MVSLLLIFEYSNVFDPLDKDFDYNIHTALMAASVIGSVEATTMLVANGADVRAPNQDGNTALEAASSFRHLEVAKMLLANGADATSKHTKDEMTALMFAIRNADSGTELYLIP